MREIIDIRDIYRREAVDILEVAREGCRLVAVVLAGLAVGFLPFLIG